MKMLFTEIEIGGEPVKVTVKYLWSQFYPATHVNSESGGAELLSIELGWTDEPWVDDLLKQIYRQEGHDE